MEFQELSVRAISIRELYEEIEKEQYGQPWTSEQIMLGFVGDVGDLAKLGLAENGHRTIADSNTKLEHELADCLWSLLVLAKLHNIDLEKAFIKTMIDLERRLSI
jgi:NTP pyrophosphatase (non-canonical NTP hydrolase)